ncbi:hypothetical protein [Cardinium endosymbiont of Philonthus spinipes]|uniref:hypothetical protein n=1 Tax=Cardinium endosymbiont of Philonthus spinipes TaxID=3077941 RepID=UPI00313B65AF
MNHPLIKPDVLPSEPTYRCEWGNRLVLSDTDNEPLLLEKKEMPHREMGINCKHHAVGGLG